MPVVPSSPRGDALDALRGALATVVFVGHGFQVFVGPAVGASSAGSAVYFAVFVAARLAVLCFFCLSGFVIAQSVRRHAAQDGGFRLGRFALARAVRLAPPLAAAVALAAALAVALNAFGLAALPPGAVAPRTTFAPRSMDQLDALLTLGLDGDLTGDLNRPLWTLALEIHLYTVAGLAARVVARGPSAVRGLAGLSLVAYLGGLAARHLSDWGLRDAGVSVVCYACFAMGWATASLPPASRSAVVTASRVAAVAAAALLVAVGRRDFIDREGAPRLVAAEAAAGLACCGLLLHLASRTAAPSLRAVSRYSYTLYATHLPLLLAAYFVVEPALRGRGPWVGATAGLAACGATALVARALGLWLERPTAQRAWILRVAGER